jgi:3-dehydroquinate synthetase
MQVNKIYDENDNLTLRTKNIIKQNFSINYQFNILFTREFFHQTNTSLTDLHQNPINGKIKLSFIIDSRLLNQCSRLLQIIKTYIKSFPSLESIAESLTIADGKVVKNSLNNINEVLNYVHQNNIDRRTYLTDLGIQDNIHKISKKILDPAALLLQQKSSIYAN